MTNKKLKSTEEKSKFRSTVNRKKTIILGSFTATIIGITPYLFYTYEGVPETKIWNTFLFTYDSEVYQDAHMVAWTLCGKLTPLLLLLIWFFTCRHWWYHAILIPIIMYIYQIIGFISSDTGFFDEFQLMHLVPFMAVILPSIYLIRARIFDRLNSIDKTTQELEDELMLKPKNLWQKIKQFF
ncbi:hypothetical protein [Lacinutrix chionoecetis]